MSDDPTPRPPDASDRRDERIAALLEVEPLDELTRRRLVTKALDAVDATAARPARPRQRLLAVAAGVAAVVAVGAGVLAVATDDGGNDTTVAGRTQKTSAGAGTEDRESAAPAVPEAQSPAADMAIALIGLGDLGDVSDPGELRETLASKLGVANRTESQERLAGASAICLTGDRAPNPPYAVGTGTVDGQPVLVLVASPPPSSVVTVLDASSCEVRSTLSL